MRTIATSCIALSALALTSAATAGDLLWDNNIDSDGFNGRALSPPIFPDIRVADDVLVPETGWLVNEMGMTGIEDADWTPGTLMQVFFYANAGGLPGALVAEYEGTFVRTPTGGQLFERDEYTYFITFDEDLLILEGTHHVGARFPEGGGDGTNYWTTSNGMPDGSATTGSFSVDAGVTWMDAGAGWHQTFELYGTVPEGAPRDAHGLRHFPDGGANITVDKGGNLVVSNIGSSGKDGVSVDLGPTAEGYTGAMSMALLADGASVAINHVGTISGTPDLALSSTTLNSNGTDVSVKPVYDMFGATTYTLNLYNGGDSVYSEGSIDPEDDKVSVPSGVLEGCKGTVEITTPTLANLVAGLDVPAPITVSVSGAGDFQADRIEFVADDGPAGLEAVSVVEFRFANTGDVSLTAETLRKFSLDNSVLAAAKFKAEVEGLRVSNIGSSGQDGVSMDLPNVLSLDASLANISFGANRARVQLTSYNGGTTVVGTVGMWNLNGLTGVPASYAGAGATEVLVEIYLGGVFQTSYVNANSGLRVALVLPLEGDEQPQLIGAGLLDIETAPGTYLLLDRAGLIEQPSGGTSADGDEVRVSAVLGGAGVAPLTTLDWTFDRIGAATITSLAYVEGGEPKCVPPALDGDSNNDGCVDFDDILVVLSNWDTDGTNGGDNDCSGLVDFDDLLSVLSGFGDGC